MSRSSVTRRSSRRTARYHANDSPGNAIATVHRRLFQSEDVERFEGADGRVSTVVTAKELDPADDVSTTIRQADLALRAAKAAGKSDYLGKTYYFCAVSCKTKFDANPQQYVK